MASVDATFVPNWPGIRDLFNGKAVQKGCLDGADKVAQHARHGKYSFDTDVQPGVNVAHARCTWRPEKAMRDLGADYYRFLAKDPATKALASAVRAYGGRTSNG